jgi:RND superfamily putative drug exporter
MNVMQGTLDEIRNNLADFDDAVRPLRNYFYWEPGSAAGTGDI